MQSRNNEIQKNFIPPLSTGKTNAISNLGMGTENKVILQFEEIFWPNIPYFQVIDQRFRFINLHYFGKDGILLAQVCPPYSSGFDSKTDSEIVEDLLSLLQRIFPQRKLPFIKKFIVTRWDEDPFADLLFGQQCVQGAHESGQTAAKLLLKMANVKRSFERFCYCNTTVGGDRSYLSLNM